MAIGNSGLLNKIKGITSVVKLTAEEKTALADRVLPANVLVVDSSNIVYLTDGVTAVKALNPLLASSNNYAYDKDVVHLTGDETIAGTKTFSAAIVGSVTGNAGSATKLATARTINGTSFDGTANITTANWGTARNITIADSTGDNTGEAVSVNGSAAVTLKLPATIKASLDGNAATATSATTAASATTATNATNAAKLGNIASSGYVQTGNVNQTIDGTKTFSAAIVGSVTGNAGSATKLATARTIALSGAATGTATDFDGTANIAIPVTSLDASKLTGTASVSTTGNAATATKLATARSLWGNNFDGSAAIAGTITGTPAIEFVPTSTTSYNGGYLDFHYNQSAADYTSRIIESASGTLSINNVTITTGKVVTATTFNGALTGNVTGNCSGSSGSCTGNAATATRANSAAEADTAANATYANWLRTSSHTDHLFHTEWDGAYFWTYVTAGDGGYRPVRVARSDSATTAEACTGNAATATRADSAASADTATNATNATNSNAANQLQAFVNDDFTGGNHYVKAIRSSLGWSTHLWMCYNNGAKMADEVSVNYANSAGSATKADTATNATNATYASRSTNNGGFYINNYLVTIG